MNVYENCPSFEDETYLLRLTAEEDIEDLLAVYSDVKAVPFFNAAPIKKIDSLRKR